MYIIMLNIVSARNISHLIVTAPPSVGALASLILFLTCLKYLVNVSVRAKSMYLHYLQFIVKLFLFRLFAYIYLNYLCSFSHLKYKCMYVERKWIAYYYDMPKLI